MLHQVLDRWFAPELVDRTVEQMLAVDVARDSVAEQRRRRLNQRIAAARRQRESLFDSIQHGVSAADVGPRMDALANEIAEAEADLAQTVVERVAVDAGELRAAVAAVVGGGLTGILAHGTAAERAEFYAGLGVEMMADAEQRQVSVTLTPTADRIAAVHEVLDWPELR